MNQFTSSNDSAEKTAERAAQTVPGITTKELTLIIGRTIKNGIVEGYYGDAALRENGFVTADPCYILEREDYDEFLRARYAQHPMSDVTRDGWPATQERDGWLEIEFHGERCFFRDCSDGAGFFGHCVDSGWVAAIPLSLCAVKVREILSPSII